MPIKDYLCAYSIDVFFIVQLPNGVDCLFSAHTTTCRSPNMIDASQDYVLKVCPKIPHEQRVEMYCVFFIFDMLSDVVQNLPERVFASPLFAYKICF